MRHLVVGTAGHIDHGKSALVEALTGVDPDRLAEERRRGITIELGFADLDLAPEGVVSLVDVPGHERFVRHMVAGATGLDAVMLVVASDEGVKPQTREHLAIASLLGLSQGFVVMSKSDLVEGELREVAALEVREFLRGSFLESAPILSVSARTKEGLEGVRNALRGLLASVPARPAVGVARLCIDRSFVMRGFGTVVTGTLTSGTLHVEDEVEILPGGARGRIRGLQVHNTQVEVATAGRRLAINLQGLDVSEAPRGSTLTTRGALLPTRRIRARLELLGDKPVVPKRGGTVHVHHGTTSGPARVRVSESPDPARPEAEIVFGRPVVLLPGDRFILRRPAPVDTIGGGVVLDAHPPKGRIGGVPIESTGSADELLRDRIARAGLEGRTAPAIAAEIGWSSPEVEASAKRLVVGGDVVRAAGLLIDAKAWRDAEADVRGRIDAFHREQPLRSGILREALRSSAARGMTAETFRALLDRLIAEGSVRSLGERVSSAAHRVVLSPGDAAASAAIEEAFLRAALDPPEAAAIASQTAGGRGVRLVELLVEEGRLVRIRDGRLFHAEALDRLRDKIRAFGKTSSTMDVATFKELAGVTRKNAIPLLEQLDDERITRRRGNVREILTHEAAR